jgi:hypothetical protein
MTLSIIDCKATPSSITIFFSEAVDEISAKNLHFYTFDLLPLAGSPTPLPIQQFASASYNSLRNAVHIKPAILPNQTTWPWARLTSGSWMGVGFTPPSTHASIAAFPPITFATRVDGEDDPARDTHRTTRAIEDAVAYPVLTEEVGFAPSPLSAPSGGLPGGRGPTSLGQTVTQAVSDVLGWKVKGDDPKGFVGALTASFTCTYVEGHTECTWTPRTYAVQSDLSGGITGAQASLYSRAQGAVSQSLPLLDGLYPLDPDADAEDVAALKGIARSQLNELVNELGVAGGPRVSRVNQYFQLLLQDGPPFPPNPAAAFVTEPDQIRGTLGKLRDELGLKTTQDFVNTVQDEQDLSNFRILSDYVTSLAQSWINNLGFFGLSSSTPFFGTQLVLLSRQLSVVAESVDEVRFTLDSVFIGPAERQTLKLQFAPGDQPLFAEDLFNWVQSFATDEGPRLIQDGGKYGVQFSFLPIVQQLAHLVKTANDPNPLDHGFRTFRVQRALKQLGEELDELVALAAPISHEIEQEPTNKEFDAIRETLALLVQRITPPPQLPQPPTLVAIPPQLNFALAQAIGQEGPPELLTLLNVSINSATISSIHIADFAPADNAQSDFKVLEPENVPITLAPQATLAVSVAFTPTEVGSRTTTLSIDYNGAGAQSSQPPLRVTLSGTGKP